MWGLSRDREPEIAVGRRGPVMGVSFHIAPKEAQRIDIWNVLELEADEAGWGEGKGKGDLVVQVGGLAGKGRRWGLGFTGL